MKDSWGNLKVLGYFHPKRRQVCSLCQKEVGIKLLSARYSDTSVKLQDLSPVLDGGTLLYFYIHLKLNHMEVGYNLLDIA
jgi:hypothetical protein